MKTKKTKILSAFCGCLMIVCSLFVLTACGHTHKFSTNWSTDATHHWHACTDKDCGEVADKDVHSGGTATYTSKAICETCGQEYGEVLGVAKVNGIGYATLQEALNTAISGDTITIIVDGTYVLPTVPLQNKNVVLTGTKDVVLDLSSLGTSLDDAASRATLKFVNITAQFNDTTDYQGFHHIDKIVYEDCLIKGKQVMYEDADFINCVFENKNDYCIWTWDAENVTFTNCTFNTGGKAVLVYNGDTSSSTVVNVQLTNCSFNDDNTLDTTKGAVETGSDANNTATGNKYNLTFTNCTVNGFAENNAGIPTSSTYFGNKNSMDTEHLNVVIDGVDVY